MVQGAMEPGSRRSVKHEYIDDLFANAAANNAVATAAVSLLYTRHRRQSPKALVVEIGKQVEPGLCLELHGRSYTSTAQTKDVIAMMCMRRKV